MAINKGIWSVIVLGTVLITLVAPFLLLVASNVGAGLLDLALNRRPTNAELVGDYRYKAKWGGVFLHLDRTGAFREEITEDGKPMRVVDGRWQATDGSNCLQLTFKPFGMVWDEDHESTTRGFGTQFYRSRSGRTYGIVNDDLGQKFEQQ